MDVTDGLLQQRGRQPMHILTMEVGNTPCRGASLLLHFWSPKYAGEVLSMMGCNANPRAKYASCNAKLAKIKTRSGFSLSPRTHPKSFHKYPHQPNSPFDERRCSRLFSVAMVLFPQSHEAVPARRLEDSS